MCKNFLYGLFEKLFALLLIFMLACSCNAPGGKKSYAAEVEQTDTSITTGNLLSLHDAERILGEPASLVDSTVGGNGTLLTWHLAYKAKTLDHGTRRTGAVYYLLEHFDDATAAHNKYQSIQKANESHGIIIRHDLGDEAYFHTDNTNFYFIMVRKGSKVFNMKVNKITGKTSLNEFNFIAIKITNTL